MTPPDIDIASRIEHTDLRPEATGEDIRRLCEEAVRHRFRGVCVTAWHTRLASQILKNTRVMTIAVVGFPLGCSPMEIVGHETLYAIDHGAHEVDMVLNTGALLSGDHHVAGATISEVVRLAHASKAKVKVILESWRFQDVDDLRRACNIAADNGADFVKTSTGFFGPQCHATPEQVAFIRRHTPNKVNVKASGGISTRQRAIELINAGATTLGTSKGVKLVT